MADLLILVFIGLMAALGYALVRRRNAAAKRDRRWHELANEMSGDAGGHPHKVIAGLQDAVAYSKGDRSRGRETLVTPDAWRGTSGRR